MRSALLACAVVACHAAYVVDKSSAKDKFWGLGAISGGGATSRLLVDYKEPQRSQILDYLFLPNFGASLQMLKVEIGGDSQSTDGTETSHMHSKDDLDVTRGYEWWLMKEAKKRNPDIKLYGLPWAFPAWVGNDPVTGEHHGSPFKYPNQTALYVTNWVKGAKEVHGLDIDFLGIWNERLSNGAYARALKSMLAAAGHPDIKLIANDGLAYVCEVLAVEKEYAAAIDIVGLHYPTDVEPYPVCHSLNKPFWSSEESSSYDDYNGAACWARVVHSHYVKSGMTSSIIWNLVGSYYHGTNWYASSLLTAVEPWSGHYDTMEVVWATAHMTQFTQIGWEYLAVGKGSGELANGGFYTTLVDTQGKDFTMLIVKISHDHAQCTRYPIPDFKVSDETATFELSSDLEATTLAVWKSNYETNVTQQFERLPDVTVVGGKVTVDVNVGDYITLTTIRTGKKGHFDNVPASSPSFPLPHVENFDSVVDGQEGAYLTDQIGAFEVHGGVLRQMVPQVPIGWSDWGSNGPMTLIGMKEFQDLDVQVDIRVPDFNDQGCIATRVNQMWKQGVVLCVSGSGVWNLTYGGPPQNGTASIESGKQIPITSGFATVRPKEWFTLRLQTVNDMATAWLNGTLLFNELAIRNIDNGFAALGANTWASVEYDNLAIKAAGTNWNPTSPCPSAVVGTELKVRDCATNGLAVDDQKFELLSNWQLRHMPSGLCATAASDHSKVTLESCDVSNGHQLFKNDYTRIRNHREGLKLHSTLDHLVGSLDGRVKIALVDVKGHDWTEWSYFPNTFQLRNVYDTETKFGYAKCLSTCLA